MVGGVEVTWVSKESVDDTSFLGEAARRLCVNTPVYWSHSYGVNTLPEGMLCQQILLLHVFVLEVRLLLVEKRRV